jgi:hypothetical protein
MTMAAFNSGKPYSNNLRRFLKMTKQSEQTEMKISPFQRLSQINVNEHVEKKNGLSYLSWAWAISELFKADPDANWEFHEPQMFGETMMVSCTVKAFGKPILMHLPVMDHRNQAIKNPDAFAVNKNMMRCLVKAIACHGLGLYIYAGEDLPENSDGGDAKHQTTSNALSESQIVDHLTAIKDAKNGRELKEAYRHAEESAANDPVALDRFIAAFNEKRASASAATSNASQA